MRAGERRGWFFAAWAAVAMLAHAADDEPSDKARRDQLNADRAAAQARYEQTVSECERGFAVTSCVNQAKAERRTALDRASREQAALDDAQRKRRAEDRRQRIAQKQAQQGAAARSAASAPPRPAPTPHQPASTASGA